MTQSKWPPGKPGRFIVLKHKDGNYGSKYPRASEFGQDGIPFLTANCLSNGYLDIQGAPKLPRDRAAGLEYGFVWPGDVLLSHNATIGRVAVVPDWDGQLMVGTSLTYYRLNQAKLLPGYLAAYFKGPDFQNQLASVMSHSTRNQIPITAQRFLKIVVPPLDVQLSISAIIGKFDERIDHNRALASSLEMTAQALFNSWFVEFDPVRAKVAGECPPGLSADLAVLFPDRLIESSQGEIPTGWRVAPLSSFANIDTTSVKPFEELDAQWTHFSIPAFDNGKIPVFENGSQIASNKYLVRPGAVLVSKLNPIEWRCWRPPSNLVSQRSVCSTEFIQLVPPLEESEFLWALCESAPFRELMLTTVHGTTGSRQRAQPKDVMRGGVLLPDNRLSIEYSKLVRPLLQRADACIVEARVLTELRDLLLPRLISGKLRVEDAEAVLEVA